MTKIKIKHSGIMWKFKIILFNISLRDFVTFSWHCMNVSHASVSFIVTNFRHNLYKHIHFIGINGKEIVTTMTNSSKYAFYFVFHSCVVIDVLYMKLNYRYTQQNFVNHDYFLNLKFWTMSYKSSTGKDIYLKSNIYHLNSSLEKHGCF